MLPSQRAGSLLACTLVCWCLLAHALGASTQLARGRAFYDEPDYDLGLGDGVPAPNQAALSLFELKQARRTHRPDGAFSSMIQSAEQPRQLPSLRVGHEHDDAPGVNMRMRQPMPDLGRALRFRDRSRSRGLPSNSFIERQSQSHANSNGFYGHAESRVDSAPVDPDDPFAGPSAMGAYASAPAGPVTSLRNDPFEAPAFAEVVSQIKEIVTHPQSAAEGAEGNHHVMSAVVPAPSVAPPMAPPPVPLSFRNGPPIPSLVQLSSKLGPGAAQTEPLVERARASVASVEPVLLENHAAASSIAHSPGPQPRFLIETEEQVQAQAKADEARRQQLEALERRRNPQHMPVPEHMPGSAAHSFIEELAGVRQTVQVQRRRVAPLPPPVALARDAGNPHHRFRQWD